MENKFYLRLKILRISCNLSQRQLAQRLNVTSAAISRWEANLQIPNIEIAIKIAKFFNVSIDYLVGLEN